MRVRAALELVAGVSFVAAGGVLTIASALTIPRARLAVMASEDSVEQAREPSVPPAHAPAAILAEEDRIVAEKVAAELAASRTWDHDAVLRVRALVGQRKLGEAAPIFEAAGFERRASRRMAILFGGPAIVFDYRLGERAMFFPAFEKSGEGAWELSPHTLENMRLPFHPRTAWTLEATSSRDGARGQYERCEAIGRHRFMSGTFTEALRCTFRFREHRFGIVTGTDLVRADTTFADRLDHALSVVPASHLALVEELSIDPGDHPRHHAGQTSWDGRTIHLYLAGAGVRVPQERLDQTTAHEIGHVISLQQGDTFWARWSHAIAQDLVGVSTYGLTNPYEDFAETYLLFLGSGPLRNLMATRYPARFAEMQSLFEALVN